MHILGAAVRTCYAHSNLWRASNNTTISIATRQRPRQLLGRLTIAAPPRQTQAQICASPYSTMAVTRPKFSAGADETTLDEKLQSLLASASGRWALTATGEGLERSFKFKTFTKTWDFMTAVSLQCKLKNHHPEWSNVYNTTFIRWTTHSPQGLSAKDVELAAICDQLARDFGEVVEETGDSNCQMRSLADTVADSAGDCCTSKKK